MGQVLNVIVKQNFWDSDLVYIKDLLWFEFKEFYVVKVSYLISFI